MIGDKAWHEARRAAASGTNGTNGTARKKKRKYTKRNTAYWSPHPRSRAARIARAEHVAQQKMEKLRDMQEQRAREQRAALAVEELESLARQEAALDKRERDEAALRRQIARKAVEKEVLIVVAYAAHLLGEVESHTRGQSEVEPERVVEGLRGVLDQLDVTLRRFGRAGGSDDGEG